MNRCMRVILLFCDCGCAIASSIDNWTKEENLHGKEITYIFIRKHVSDTWVPGSKFGLKASVPV